MSGELETRLWDALEAFAASRGKKLSVYPLHNLSIPLEGGETLLYPMLLLKDSSDRSEASR